jgi:5-methylthioadenosine/S-adenosylhomocysteine deaminase
MTLQTAGVEPVAADLLIVHTTIVTMDGGRRVIADGALAVMADKIVAVGKTTALQAAYRARETIDGSRFVLTPGLVNAHIHVTGEPLTRGYAPDDISFGELIGVWLAQAHKASNENDERLGAQFSALEMLRTGTTCFLDAGTNHHVDAVADGMLSMGIRGRIAQFARDNPGSPSAQPVDPLLKQIESHLDRYPPGPDKRIVAWPILTGRHNISDALWQGAKHLADARGLGLSFHMSPIPGDPAWFLAHHGRRPVEHLAKLGVLGRNVALTHAVHLDANEVALLAEAHATVVHCPMTALRGAYGATSVGLFPEMARQGVNLALGSDGSNDSNSHDLHRACFLVAGLFKDARQDPTIFPAGEAYAMATLNGARALLMEDEIGTIEPGRKADFVLHDTWRPEWRPLFDVANQLVWSADGRGVHSVWVDGIRVIDNFRPTMIDEERLLAQVQEAGDAIVARMDLPSRAKWPTV